MQYNNFLRKSARNETMRQHIKQDSNNDNDNNNNNNQFEQLATQHTHTHTQAVTNALAHTC